MEGKVKMFPSYAIGGYTGWRDSSDLIYSVHAKISNFATPEQTGKLEAKLLDAYRTYLEEVAADNNGRY